jgi:ribonuclease P protein component
MNTHLFPKVARVTRGDDFSEIIRRGPYAADATIVVNVRWARISPGCDAAAMPLAKLGISIPKKTGNAVVRNRWKRWIREAFRTQRTRLPRGIEIVIRPKRDAVGSFQVIADSLVSTVTRAVRKLPARETLSGQS